MPGQLAVSWVQVPAGPLKGREIQTTFTPVRSGRLAAVATAAVLLVSSLTACTATPDPPDQQSPTTQSARPPVTPTATATRTTMGPGTYIFKAPTGGTGTMEIPAEPVAEIEELRTLVNAAPVTYLTAAVDNRQGSVAISMDSVSIFTPEGEEFKYEGASEYVDKLRRALPAAAPVETYNRFINVSNAYLGDAPPLALKDFVLLGPEVPQEISGVIVNPTGGFHPVPALPAG